MTQPISKTKTAPAVQPTDRPPSDPNDLPVLVWSDEAKGPVKSPTDSGTYFSLLLPLKLEYKQFGSVSESGAFLGPLDEVLIGATYYNNHFLFRPTAWFKTTDYGTPDIESKRAFGWKRNQLRESTRGARVDVGYRFHKRVSLLVGAGAGITRFEPKYPLEPSEKIYQARSLKFEEDYKTPTLALGLSLCVGGERGCITLDYTRSFGGIHTSEVDAENREIPGTEKEHSPWSFSFGFQSDLPKFFQQTPKVD